MMFNARIKGQQGVQGRTSEAFFPLNPYMCVCCESTRNFKLITIQFNDRLYAKFQSVQIPTSLSYSFQSFSSTACL